MGGGGCLLCAFNSLEKKKFNEKSFVLSIGSAYFIYLRKFFFGGGAGGGLLANKLSNYHI